MFTECGYYQVHSLTRTERGPDGGDAFVTVSPKRTGGDEDDTAHVGCTFFMSPKMALSISVALKEHAARCLGVGPVAGVECGEEDK